MRREVVYIARGEEPGTVVLRRSAREGHLIPTAWSVISPGTERWQLTTTTRGPAPLGYMSIGSHGGEYLLAPAPHGNYFDADDPGVLAAAVPAEPAAIARFQLMAAAGLRPVAARLRDAENFFVVGSGPVAFGAVLEILRSSGAAVTVITARRARAERLLDSLGRVEVRGEDALRGAANIIECTGAPEKIRACVAAMAPGALLGILGSPREVCAMDIYAVHRAGATLLGMHELAQFDVEWRRQAFREIAAWLAQTRPHERGGWIASTPAGQYAALYDRLQRGQVAEPFQLLDWRGADA